MTEIDLSKDNALPKLSAYLSALFDIPEKNLDFLPCYQGYLVAVYRKKHPICLWIHKSTVESVLKIGFNLIWETAEDIVFSLVWGAWALRQFVLEKYIPEPPKNTVIFLPDLHSINYGIINVDSGATGVVIKGINTASSILSKTGKSVADLIRKTTKIGDGQTKSESINDKLIENKTYTYISFPDKLHHVLSQEKKFNKLSNLSGGFEFRSVYVELTQQFLKKLEKSKFSINFKGKKSFI